MDPITSGLTILQVVEAIAQASALLYRYIASVRDADSSCRSLLNELRSLGGVLSTVMEIEQDHTLPDNLRGALSRLMIIDGPVAKLQVELRNLLPTEPQNSKMGMKDKFMWPFKEQKIAAIVDKLKQYYCDISTILSNRLKCIKDLTLKEVHRGVPSEGHEEGTARPVRQIPAALRPGQWIFETNHYKTWNTSDCAFLWLNGQPGAGKTILASAVIDKIRGDGEAEPQTLAYFYCNFRDEKTTIASAVLRTLACNLLRESTNDWITKIGEREQQQSDAEEHFISLRKLGQQYRSGEKCPTDLNFLRKLIVEASKLVPRPVLVIDALDECKDYCDLVEHLTNLADDARLRLFVTSRIEPDIRDAFRHLPTMSLKDTAGTNEERHTCAHYEAAEDPEAFRWVQCQLDEILTCKRSASIRKALDNLPKGLYETYDRIIRSIEERGDDDGPIAQRCLLLLAGTFEPLTLDELNEAMMIEVEESRLNRDLRVNVPMDIVVACGSLVAYDEATGVVALSHYSVKV
ncbi:hypothetical protein DFH29DRAFT_883673 [Suillus ampliporus]|nr:hypothetical protein DFH29DRAFT_883673 [Suillus ampliporus]